MFEIRNHKRGTLSEAGTLIAAYVACRTHHEDGEELPLVVYEDGAPIAYFYLDSYNRPHFITDVMLAYPYGAPPWLDLPSEPAS